MHWTRQDVQYFGGIITAWTEIIIELREDRIGANEEFFRPSLMAYMSTEQHFLQNVNILFSMCTYNGNQM